MTCPCGSPYQFVFKSDLYKIPHTPTEFCACGFYWGDK